MAFMHFRNRLAEAGVPLAEVAASVGDSERELRMKLDERIPMSVSDVLAIRERYLPGESLDVLLASDGDVAGEDEQRRNLADIAIRDCIRAIREA